MKLNIIYRCCNNEVDSPMRIELRQPWFDKLKCLSSFLKSVEQCKEYINDVIFLHDGKKGRLFDNIPKHFKILEVNYKSNEASLLETFKIADELSNNIYFVEDDHLHLPHSIKTIALGVEKFQLVTGYDHLDRYTRTDDITLGKEYVAFSQKTNCHWRTCESTCCTWATTKELWQGVVGKYAKYYKLQDRELFRRLYLEQHIRLWNPIPGVATQSDKWLSPGIDWKNIE